jgi:putative iron-dependent peroxidase
MDAPQPGIFALSDTAHVFLEFTLNPGARERRLVELAVGLHEPYTTVGGMNLVLGFRPELWRGLAPNDTPDDAHDFSEPIAGIEGFTIPATQADLWVWLAAGAYDRLWDAGREAIQRLAHVAHLERQLRGWPYRRSRDLTGFEDGTENPTLLEAPGVALVPAGRKGAGASIVLFQTWRHEESWFRLSVGAQEAAMGRTKAASVEFEGERVISDSHVSRAKDVVDGQERDIFRRNVPYGDLVDYGTTFIGFSCEQSRLHRMLVRMAGAEDGIRDAITRHTTPLTGAYYVVPAVAALGSFAPRVE